MGRSWVILLAICMLLSGCAGKESQTSWPRPTMPAQGAMGDYGVDGKTGTVLAGKVTTALAGESAGRVSYNETWPGTPGADYTDPADYTLREYLSSTTGLKWAPHTWETADDRYILDYTSTGFYELVLNAEGTGWTIVDEMAVGAPVDVTAQYVGKFGIQDGESGRAWRIALNPAACWDNQVAIDADTYMYSYQQLLDPKMQNRRADSLYAGEFAIVGAKDYLYGACGWENVGILKTGQYEVVLITTAAIAEPEFYVPYYLGSTFLVYEPLWEACKTGFDKDGKVVAADSAAAVSVSTNYATSLETSISYGPYKLVYFELDKQITLQRNESWYGYQDGKHLGQYQTDRISCQILSSPATALLAFLAGDLDRIDLRAEDMSRFATSDAVRYRPESYTTKLTFNTDVEALRKRGTEILAVPAFRQAFSLAIDRSRFASAFTSAGVAGYGLLNHVYVYDPFSGASYRNSDGAKNALVQLYGLHAEDFGGLQGAYGAITGYDPAYAQALMQQAYEEAVAAGLYDGQRMITLQLSVYQSQDVYVQMYHFLQEALALACRGTDLQGKVKLEMVVDADYYATMESGLTDMIFSTWGGSAYDPYGVLYQCYCDAGVAERPNQMEYGFDAGSVMVQMQIDGAVYRHSLQDWARWCSGDRTVELPGLLPFRSYDADTRSLLYANLEYAYLSQYVTTPLYYRNGAALHSAKGDEPVQQAVEPVGFGGVRFYGYVYDDVSWEKVKSQMQY